MVNLRSETYGPGSLKGVNLAVIAYDNRVSKNKDSGEITNHYLDARMHPGDERAKDQVSLALVSVKDEKSPNGFNNSARYSASQFDAIKEAAGDNTTPLTNQAGDVVGTIYGVKADLFINDGKLVINSKTLEATEHSVQPNAEGKDIRTQIFDSMAAAKEARDEAKAAKAPAAEAEATVEAEAPAASNDEPELG